MNDANDGGTAAGALKLNNHVHGEVLAAEVLAASLSPDLTHEAEADLPDAAARDAALREQAGEANNLLSEADFRFITRDVSAEERAAVIAVLAQIRHEETQRVRRIESQERQPWARSQRVPVRITDLLISS